MFEQLLPDPSPAVLSLLELVEPLVDRGVEFGKSLLLLKQGLMLEIGPARRP